MCYKSGSGCNFMVLDAFPLFFMVDHRCDKLWVNCPERSRCIHHSAFIKRILLYLIENNALFARHLEVCMPCVCSVVCFWINLRLSKLPACVLSLTVWLCQVLQEVILSSSVFEYWETSYSAGQQALQYSRPYFVIRIFSKPGKQRHWPVPGAVCIHEP